MAEEHSLILKVDSRQVKNAEGDLNWLTNASGKAEVSTNKLTTSFFSLSRVLTATAILGTTAQFIKLADTMTWVESKLKLVTSSTLELKMAQQELFEISQKTRTGFASNVDLYQKMAMSTKELNLSQKDMFELINSINKSISISSTNAAGAETLITQLGQAFSSNFQGVAQELGTLRDQAPRLYQAILEGTGMTARAFRKAAEDGKLSSEIIIDALRKQGIAIDKDFGKVGITVETSMTVLANSITNMIGKADKQLGATGLLGTLITDISKHIDENTQDWVDSVQSAMDTMYPVAEAGFTNIRDLSEVTFEGVNALFSVMVHAFDGAIDSMDNKYRELGFFDYMSLGFIVVIEGFRQIASGGLSALTFLGKQFNTFQSIALDAIAGVMGAMGKFQNAVGGDGSSFLEAQAFWANKANKVKQDGLLIDRTQKAILDDMGKGVDRLIGSYDKLALKKVKAKEVDTVVGGKDKPKGVTAETDEQKKAREKAKKEAEQLQKDIEKARLDAMQDNADREAEMYIGVYQAQLDAAQFNIDQITQMEIDKYNAIEQAAQFNIDQITQMEIDKYNAIEQAAQDSADRQSEILLSIYNDSFPDSQKIIDKYTEIFDAIKDMPAEFIQKAATQIDEELANIKIDTFTIDFEIEGLDGVPKQISSISKALSNLQKEDKKYQKNKEKYQERTIEYNQNEEDHTNNQIVGYANLAGAVGSFFEKGSAGAKAMQVVSATLGIAQGVQAMISAWGSAPFPLNMPAVAATTAAVLPMIGQLTSMGGSGGAGVGSTSTPTPNASDYENKSATINFTYEPMINRLDRQIQLLESIDRNGSAVELGVKLSKSEYERSYATLVEDSLNKMFTTIYKSYGSGNGQHLQVIKQSESNVESALGFDLISTVNDSYATINKDMLREGNNFISLLEGLSNGLLTSSGLQTDWSAGGYEIFFDKDWAKAKLTPVNMAKKNISEMIDAYQQMVSDYTQSLLDSLDSMTSAKESIKESYDTFTGTTFFKDEDLAKAFTTVNQVVADSGKSFENFMLDSVRSIDTAEAFLKDANNLEALLSEDPTKLKEKIAVVDAFNKAVGTSIADTDQILNYVDAIKLVAEATAELTSLKTDMVSFIDELRNSIDSTDTSGTFIKFSTSFDNMIDSIANGSSNISDIGNKAIDDAKSYLKAIESATDTKQRDIDFAKAVIANKFESVVLTPNTSLSTVNDTLRFNHEALILQQIKQNDKLNDIIRVLNESRDISNSSLVTLQTIEAVS